MKRTDFKRIRSISNINPLFNRSHGGKNALNLPNKNKILDFSVSINPYGPPSEIQLSLNLSSVREYPDPQSKELTKLLASINNLDEENIFTGNGSAEIIALLFFCFVKKKDVIISLWPSFGEYRYYARITQSKFVQIKLNLPDFKLNLSIVNRIIKKHKPKLFFFCNPNNPTGNYYSEKEVVSILESLPEGTLFVLDEAYVNLVLSKWNSVNLLKQFKNLVILRSLTKDYALTALRLGYSMTSKEVTYFLRSACPSWNINTLAQRNGVRVFNNKTFLEKSVLLLHKEKGRIEKVLKKLGYSMLPSSVNFYLLEIKNAKEATRLLLSNNIYVRDCTNYDLPQYLRITVKSPQENNYLLKVLGNLAYKIKP